MMAQQIITVLKSVNSVKEFIEGGGLAVALKEIGGIEMDAAILCLSNIREAREPKREVQLAVGHLQSAHFAFKKALSSLNAISAAFTHDDNLRTLGKLQQVNVLMAICYSYLHEHSLMIESLQRAEEPLKWRSDNLIPESDIAAWFQIGIGLLNPAHWRSPFGDRCMIESSELSEIRSKLELL
jgi:hypothetical protein